MQSLLFFFFVYARMNFILPYFSSQSSFRESYLYTFERNEKYARCTRFNDRALDSSTVMHLFFLQKMKKHGRI